ncbi:MAG: glycosyltransferase family 4 protein, partial [Planctomycetota bacterium]
MDDLRVLMLNYEFPPLGGGAGRATSYLLEAFAARGSVQVDLVTSSATSRIERVRLGPGIEAIRLPVGKRRRHYWTARELARWSSAARGHARRLARERRYDLCHCWSGWPAGLIGAGLRPRLPYLVGLRGSDVPGYSRRLRYLDPVVFRPLSRRIWRRAAAITCLSHDLRALAARTAPGLDMHVVRNGVDCDRFRPGPAPETFTILFVGRLVDRKGVVHLLQAFARLASSGPPCRLLVAGDGPLRGSLGDVARRLGVDSAVTFLDIVDHERLPELYRQASVLAMPSYEEALGNAVLEGMAAGLAIVTTPTGAAE